MSDFKAKMHQIRFRLGLRPRPRWGSLQLDLRGPTSNGGEGREGMGMEGRGGREREERGGEVKNWTPWSPKPATPLHFVHVYKYVYKYCMYD